MNAALPDGPRGQALAVGLTVIAAAAIWLGAISPLLALHSERSDALEQRRVLATHMEDLVASLPDLRRQEALMATTGARPVPTLDGATDAIAGAALQERLQALALSAGANLASLETLPAEPRGAYRRIGVRVTAVANWPPLVGLLRAVESATPRMVLDDVEVHGPPVRNLSADTFPLRAAFTLFAFRAGTEPAAPAARP